MLPMLSTPPKLPALPKQLRRSVLRARGAQRHQAGDPLPLTG